MLNLDDGYVGVFVILLSVLFYILKNFPNLKE